MTFKNRKAWLPMHRLLGYSALGVDGKGYKPSSSKSELAVHSDLNLMLTSCYSVHFYYKIQP